MLGKIGGVFNRAKLANGTTENRGGESTLGNLVAEVQRWATRDAGGGRGADRVHEPGRPARRHDGHRRRRVPADLTYKQAAVVQPFANTLVNMNLTGANIKLALEQQWQRDASGNIPSRPFLRLGISKGFTYTYDPAKAEGSRITGMWLNGVAIDPTATYSVTVNSFLASGGDNFRAFTNGTGKRDTGKVDLQAMVDYMAEFAADDAAAGRLHAARGRRDVPEPARRRRTSRATTCRSTSRPGACRRRPTSRTRRSRSSWAARRSAPPPLDNTVGTDVFDEYGKASVDVVLPAGVPGGAVS